MSAPSEDTIKRLKEQHPDRALHLCELQNPGDDEIHHVVMTGPTSDEYRKFQDDIMLAREQKTEAEKSAKLLHIAQNAILRQAIWPDRDEVKQLLHRNPGFTLTLADKIHEHAGSSAEVRSKKL